MAPFELMRAVSGSRPKRSQHRPRKTMPSAGCENHLNPAGDSFVQGRGSRFGQNSFAVEQRSIKIAGKDPRRTGLTRWHTPSLIGDNEVSMYKGEWLDDTTGFALPHMGRADRKEQPSPTKRAAAKKIEEDREIDHRGVVMPRRTRIGGIIMPQ